MGYEKRVTDEITCPWCGNVSTDSFEYDSTGNIECDECGKHFFYERNVSVAYTSVKLHEGECIMCHETKILSERTKVNGEYVDVCEDCKRAKDIARCKEIFDSLKNKE